MRQQIIFTRDTAIALRGDLGYITDISYYAGDMIAFKIDLMEMEEVYVSYHAENIPFKYVKYLTAKEFGEIRNIKEKVVKPKGVKEEKNSLDLNKLHKHKFLQIDMKEY